MGVEARASGAARRRVLAGRARERRARGADMVGWTGVGGSGEGRGRPIGGGAGARR